MVDDTFDLVFRSKQKPGKLYRAKDVDTFFLTDPDTAYECENNEEGDLECLDEGERLV